jgi:hypothetical protein
MREAPVKTIWFSPNACSITVPYGPGRAADQLFQVTAYLLEPRKNICRVIYLYAAQ